MTASVASYHDLDTDYRRDTDAATATLSPAEWEEEIVAAYLALPGWKRDAFYEAQGDEGRAAIDAERRVLDVCVAALIDALRDERDRRRSASAA